MNFLSKITKFILLITISLSIFQVIVANYLSTAGVTLNLKTEEREILKAENELLEKKIASSSSLVQISQKVITAGFVKPQTIYLAPILPIAFSEVK